MFWHYIFVEALHKKSWEKSRFCNKTKTEHFLENQRYTFLDIEKNFTKTESQTKFIKFSLVWTPRTLDGIWKLKTIWDQFAWQICNNFFMKNLKWQYLEYELWGIDKICWVVRNITPQIKQCKNTSKRLVIL